MSSDRDRFRVELDVDPGISRRAEPNAAWRELPPASGPFRIALIGDFSARGHRGMVETGPALSARRPLRFDRDSLDDAIATLAPSLTLTLADGTDPITVGFGALDEFHPDSLFQRLPVFRALLDGAERAAAGASLGIAGARTLLATPAGVLDAILGASPEPPGGAALVPPTTQPALAERDGGLSAFVAQAVARHVVREPDGAEVAARADANESIAATMRALLHHPEFQRLEALWRGAALLAARLDTDSALQLYLVDVAPGELAADLSGRSVDQSGMYRLLVDGASGPWALIAPLFPLGDDPALVGWLGVVARDAGAALVAGAHPRILGIEDIATTPDSDDWILAEAPGWSDLRASSVAPHIALVFPRLLLRLPYGEHGAPCDLFPFEELTPDRHPHKHELLWGSGALAAALLLGEAFVEGGWNLRLGREISGLPLYVYHVKGEPFALPCAEAVIGERLAERVLDTGPSPVAAMRDSDTVIVPRLQSIAAPPTPLRGGWSHTR